MPLTLTMQTKEEFIPEHKQNYIAFLVNDLYGELQYVELACEFSYNMVDADDGYALPCTLSYKGDDFPFDKPCLFEGGKPYALTPEQIKERQYHDNPEQRFWWEKTWYFVGLGDSHLQIHPYELDSMSLGIIKEKDFMNSVIKANTKRLDNKNLMRNSEL